MREFGLGEGCFSCDYRCNKSGSEIQCSTDGEWYWEKIVCTSYKPTTDERILSYAKRVIPSAFGVSDWLTGWLKKCGVLKPVPYVDVKK